MSRCTNLGILGAAIATAALLTPGVAAAADTPAAPTFTKDIAPIFQEKCEACHRSDSIAPMSLVTYEEARPWARSIRSRVEARQMPPWHIDKTVGIQEFKNDRSLIGCPDCDRPEVGGLRRPEGRHQGPAGREAVADGAGLELRRAVRPEGTRPDHPLDPLAAEGWRERHVVEAGRRDRAHRAALGPRDRDPSRHREGPQDHASRHRPPAAGRDRRARAERPRSRTATRSPARSWNGPSASRAR